MTEEWLVTGGGFGAVVIGASWMLHYIMRRLERISRDYRELVTNHLRHNTQALIDLRNTLDEVRRALERERRG